MSRMKERIMGLIDRVLHPDGNPRSVGVYSTHEKCLDAINYLKNKGFSRLVIYSPIPSHEIEEALGKGAAVIKWFTLAGGISGGAGGFLLAALTSLEWGIHTGGKPIISVPPFLIITFECTILFGALATLLGFLHASRIPQPKLSKVYMEEFGEDRFGVGIVCGDSEVEEAEMALRDSGADEVRRASHA